MCNGVLISVGQQWVEKPGELRYTAELMTSAGVVITITGTEEQLGAEVIEQWWEWIGVNVTWVNDHLEKAA